MVVAFYFRLHLAYFPGPQWLSPPGPNNFWCSGYYVDTVGRNKKIIAEYIRNQLEEDYAADQISIKEYVDPFTGDKNKKA